MFFRGSDEVDYANLQHEFYPLRADIGAEEKNFADGYMFSMGIMRPASRGMVRLKSANPAEHPSIRFNYLEAPSDCQEMIDGVRRTREMAAQSAWEGCGGPSFHQGLRFRLMRSSSPGCASIGSTEYHPCSSCRMGNDEMSVTDGEGRVHEVEGLRVIDASIMPNNVTANLNAPVIMMAEKLSDAVLGKPSLAPLYPPLGPP